jgi:hypothetical protein
MFPATALAFRRGDIRAASQPVVYEERALENIWERKVPLIAEAGKFDPNRDAGVFAPKSPIKQEVDRLAFFVGPVHVKYGGDPANSRIADLSTYIDSESGIVRSITGEIELDHHAGTCTVDTPRFQGVCGFLADAGGRFDLADVRIESGNEYATVAVVSLDGNPLNESERVLAQVGTVLRMSGWLIRPDTIDAEGTIVQGKRIVDTGRPPWRVANTEVTLTIRNGGLTRATLLDENGYRKSDLPVSRGEDQTLVVELPVDAMYVVFE